MNQKKHLNAIAALEASKDAEPGSVWNADHCRTDDGYPCCIYKCYAGDHPYKLITCQGRKRTVSEVRAALQSGLDAYHKRKAEKAQEVKGHEIEAIWFEETATFTPPPAPLIPDPPDTPEVRKQMEAWAAWKDGDISPCCKSGTDWFCEAVEYRRFFAERGRKDVHAFALSWLSRHPAKWDAEKRRFTLAERHARMRKWAEAVIKHYPIPDEDSATVWQPGMMDSRLLADEVIAYLADLEPEA